MAARKRSGGEVLADQLIAHGVDMAFGVPGESYLDLLNALYDRSNRITYINARHEAGAAHMAEAYGKLTGRPGVCMVTRGPGACHGAIGVHTARQDSTPMIMLVGQVGREALDREALQEIDYRQMFGPVAKWAAQIDDAARIPEYLARAFHVATSGRPGPVVLALPEDMLTDRVAVSDALPVPEAAPAPAPGDLAQLRRLLAKAKRPLAIVGGSRWDDGACRRLVEFAEAWRLPVCASFRRGDICDNRSPSFIGEFNLAAGPALVERFKAADLILAVGCRLNETTTRGYTTLAAPQPKPVLIHIHPDPDELGRVYRPHLAIVAGPAAIAAALAGLRPPSTPRWVEWTRAARADYLAAIAPPGAGGPALDMGAAFASIRDSLPPDTIITVDAGNHTSWTQRFLQVGRPGRLLGPISGAMGYGTSAAVAASLVHPDRLVIGTAGDGGFQMTGMEIATARQHGAKPIILVFNNHTYGTIRSHQETHYPGRVVATDLVNPDFAALAAACGAHGETVTRTEEFAPAFARARAAGKVAVIDLKMDPEVLTSRTTVAGLRARKR